MHNVQSVTPKTDLSRTTPHPGKSAQAREQIASYDSDSNGPSTCGGEPNNEIRCDPSASIVFDTEKSYRSSSCRKS